MAKKPTSASPPEEAKKRILVVDDHPIVRERLAEMINRENDLIVCGEAEDAHQALAAVQTLHPELAIVDITLKDTYGIELVRDLKSRHPGLAVLVLSMHDESVYAERALRAGARGYICKVEPASKVIEAIRGVLRGEIYASEAIKMAMLRGIAGASRGESASRSQTLSNRELEIYDFLGDGLSVQQIAKSLHISPKTVEAHRANIKAKLNLKTSADLLRHAIESRLQGE